LAKGRIFTCRGQNYTVGISNPPPAGGGGYSEDHKETGRVFKQNNFQHCPTHSRTPAGCFALPNCIRREQNQFNPFQKGSNFTHTPPPKKRKRKGLANCIRKLENYFRTEPFQPLPYKSHVTHINSNRRSYSSLAAYIWASSLGMLQMSINLGQKTMHKIKPN